jgi:hypothetical protein
MTKPKYKITEQHLDTRAGISRLERDGFKRQDISLALYAHSTGASKDERAKIMKKLHDRSGEC